MKKMMSGFVAALVLMPMMALAGTTVVEGDEAKKIYDAKKATSQTLVQKDKKFIVRAAGGAETADAATLSVAAGETFFLTNEEEKYVHNVYDNTDNSWVLKKQEPSQVAAITFAEAGEHMLRCAIHPTMKITVTVK